MKMHCVTYRLVHPDNVTSHSDITLIAAGNVAVNGKYSPTAQKMPEITIRSITGLDGRRSNLVGDVLAPQVGTVVVARCEIMLYSPLVLFIHCGHPKSELKCEQ